ncbi:MAG: membrane dipeptidase [Bacteroidota bacterium]
MQYIITDLHCDLLTYLAIRPGASIHKTEDIGVALPFLQKGGVRHQILAMFSFTKAESAAFMAAQIDEYRKLCQAAPFYPLTRRADASQVYQSEQIAITPAIENASGLCEEDEPLDRAFQRLDALLHTCDHLFYIGFTHHTENRFGGGNYSDNIGLKRDGELLLDYLDGKGIAADLAHASDNLAEGIFNYIDKKGLKIPVIASHSNFRRISPHVRNLPDALVDEVVRRNGLIGINFLRAYIHPTDPHYLDQHISHGLREYPNQMAWGADFFDRAGIPDPERQPLFFTEHEDASKYPALLQTQAQAGFEEAALQKLCSGNVQAFIQRSWNS